MAKNKSFKTDPTLTFISKESIEAVDGKEPSFKGKAPEGYKVDPHYIETKSRRLQLLIQPSVHEEAKRVSNELGISLNDFVNRAIQEAVYNDDVKKNIKKSLER